MTDSTRRADLEATCREVIDFLMDYLEGDLAPERRRAFDEHLAECPSCLAYLATYRATVALARGSAGVAPPLDEAVALRLVRAIRDTRSQ